MNKISLHEVNYQLKSTTYKNRLSRIPRILDSGANIIAIHPEDSMKITPTHKPLQASTETGAIMESTAETRLTFWHKFKNFPQEIFQGHVLPSLARHTIVGLGFLCNHGCVVVLTGSKAYVLHKNKLLLTGERKKGQLWYLKPMKSGDKHTVNEIENKSETTSITKTSYLDMPMLNYISSVYQANRYNVTMGTIKWKVEGDSGKVHTFRIPNSYYVPDGGVRIFSHQHWAKPQRIRNRPKRIGNRPKAQVELP